MNTKRDKFLTEAMVERWNNDFSTWQSFGKLWEWAQEQEWWVTFTDDYYGPRRPDRNVSLFFDVNYIIHPNNFANAVYDYLKSKDNQ